MSNTNLQKYDAKSYNDNISTMLNSLFANPPGGLGGNAKQEFEIFCNFYGKTPKQVRAELIEAVVDGKLTPWQQDRISACSKHAPWVLSGKDITDMIERIEKRDQPDTTASSMMATIFHTNEGQRYFENMDAKLRVKLSVCWTRPMVLMSRFDIFPRLALAELLQSTPESLRPILLEQYESSRAYYGISFDCVYAEIESKYEVGTTLGKTLQDYKLCGTTESSLLQ